MHVLTSDLVYGHVQRTIFLRDQGLGLDTQGLTHYNILFLQQLLPPSIAAR